MYIYSKIVQLTIMHIPSIWVRIYYYPTQNNKSTRLYYSELDRPIKNKWIRLILKREKNNQYEPFIFNSTIQLRITDPVISRWISANVNSSQHEVMERQSTDNLTFDIIYSHYLLYTRTISLFPFNITSYWHTLTLLLRNISNI
jgi:hypothetical protein